LNIPQDLPNEDFQFSAKIIQQTTCQEHSPEPGTRRTDTRYSRGTTGIFLFRIITDFHRWFRCAPAFAFIRVHPWL